MEPLPLDSGTFGEISRYPGIKWLYGIDFGKHKALGYGKQGNSATWGCHGIVKY
jgi:hypothetical protein